jgi:FkbM family methyltransferase
MFFAALPSMRDHHAPGTKSFAFLSQVARKEIENLWGRQDSDPKIFGPFGEIVFPYHRMGAVDSLNLFDLNELILFSFYWINRRRYRHVLDIGGNLGLHALLLSKCGYEIRTFEPDPEHYRLLSKNLALNGCQGVQASNAAVSGDAGEKEFIRVLGNTTASHLAGSKASPYGALERFPVRVESIEPMVSWADLVKIDAEGQEKEILLAVRPDRWAHLDALVEVENGGNARALYQHFSSIGTGLFSQKKNWKRVKKPEDMPLSYREGTLFVTSKKGMPWT